MWQGLTRRGPNSAAMTSRQRMLTALRRGLPDRVPVWELIVNQPAIAALAGPQASYFDLVEALDLDGVTIFENQRLRPAADGAAIDEWGITWATGAAGVAYPVRGPIASSAELRSWRAPDPDAPWRLDDLRRAVARFGGGRAIVFLTHDAFEFSANLRGMANLLVDYIEAPEFARELAERVIEYKLGVLRGALEAGADVVVAGDDYAWRRGPIMSPRHFREFVVPHLRQLVELTHAAGKPFIKHTDGFIWPLMDDLLGTGIDALHPLEPIAGMDIGEVKARCGDRIALCGNLDCTVLLPRASAHEVEQAVKETIAKAGPGGGYVLSSSNSIHPGVRPESFRAMVEAARRWGRYPLDEDLVAAYRGRDYMAALRE
jgi:uroporphyrinogen decarboxylase